MKSYKLFSTLSAIIIIACLFGLQASATESAYQYSQFYTMTSGSISSNAISASQQIEIAGNTPSHVYLGEQMQSVSYTQYQSTPSYTNGNFLWIKGVTAWTQYAVVPQGASVSLLAISSTGGSGSFAIDSQTYSNNYVFYPNSQLTFYAGTIGRHTLSFALNGWASNQVVINVVAATSYTQPNYYPGYYWYYTWDNYQSYNKPSNPPRDHPKDGDPSKKPSENPNDNPGGNHGGNPPGGDPSGNPGGDPGNKPSEKPNDNPIGNPGGNPSGTPSGTLGGDTNTGGNPGNAPSITSVDPSTNVPTTNPSGDSGGKPGGTTSGGPQVREPKRGSSSGSPSGNPSGDSGGNPGGSPGGDTNTDGNPGNAHHQ